MQRYKAVIFDFDGTLANSLPWLSTVFNDVARRYGFRTVAHGEVEHLRHQDATAIMAHLGIPFWKVPLVAAHLRRLAERDVDLLDLHDGVELAIRDLSESGVKLGIVSSNLERNVRHVLKADLASRISCFACSASLFGKARRLKSVLRQLGLPPEACIYVGDEARDFHAAKAVGMHFGAVGWGYARPDSLQKLGPDLFLAAVTQLGALASEAPGRVAVPT